MTKRIDREPQAKLDATTSEEDDRQLAELMKMQYPPHGRLLDAHRHWAAKPFIPTRIVPDIDTSQSAEWRPPYVHWRLWEGDKGQECLVSEWDECAAPGLGEWLYRLLPTYRAAWELAQVGLKSLPAQRKSAAETAAARKGKGKKREVAIAEIERRQNKGFNPAMSIPEIAKKAGCTETYVRRILRCV